MLADGERAMRDRDRTALARVAGDLRSLHDELIAEYTLTIVSRPGDTTGIWRRPPRGSSQLNYYLIVEAITPAGGKLTLPVRNEETGETTQTDKFAVRVPQATYEAVRTDKQDDGIVQRNRSARSAEARARRRVSHAVRGRDHHQMVTSPTWTGRQTLREIKSTVGRLRTEEGQLDAAISSAAGEAQRLSHDRAEALRELARIKLDEMTAGRLVRGLDAAEQRALQVLENVRLKLSSIHAEHEKAVAELAAAEVERNDAAGAVEAAVDAVDEVRAEAEVGREDPRWATAEQQVDAARQNCGRGREEGGPIHGRTRRQTEALR